MIDIEKFDKFHSSGINKKKKQIILANTGRTVENYLTSLKNRHNKKYKKIPNYVITREGKIIQTLNEEKFNLFFNKEVINKNSIIIVFENLGWLEKRPFSNSYVNWIGDIYNGEIIERKWRDYFFWHPYTQKQLEVSAELCQKLIEYFSIDKKCVGHNTKIDGVEKFSGVVSKSNFDSKFTDLTPAFDFKAFLKFFENEQFV